MQTSQPTKSQIANVTVVGCYPDSVVDFRGDLIGRFRQSQCNVTIMTASATKNAEDAIQRLGVEFRPFWIERNKIDISSDSRTIKELQAAFVDLKPDIILAYTIKPIIWGGIAARRCPQADFFALVTGLGYAFQGGSFKRRLLNLIVTHLYRYSLKRAKAVIFQNSDNRDLFVQRKIVPMKKCHVVNGSGVNVADYPKTSLPSGPTHFLLIARLLGEKGIREYYQAAKIVKQIHPNVVFSLVGPEDPSPDGISLVEIQKWHDSGVIQYHGATNNVQSFIAESHIYTLPSYHEGMPRTVLESMAMGRPILTTDVTGCRETVEPGVNGFLVPKQNVETLAERMIWFIENRDKWQSMGDASRKIVEDKFDVHKVNAEMLKIMGIQP